MKGSEEDPAEGRRGNLWKAVAGTIAFGVLGLVFAPSLGTRDSHPQPDRTAEPTREAQQAARRSAAPGAPGETAVARPEPDSFDCMISANDTVDVGSPIRGRISDLPVERGDYVEAGQVLAQLDASVEEAAVRVAKARAERLVEIESASTSLALDQSRRDRALRLFDQSALSLDRREEVEAKARISALEVEESRENHRLAQLQLEQAIADRERRTIRSPISGYVVERLMSPGEVIDEEPMLRIAQVDPLRVEAILPSEWFGRPRRGGRAEIVPEAPLDAPRSAEVSIIDPVIDGASGTFGVRLRLPNPNRDLPAGLRCRVRFLADEPERARPLAGDTDASPAAALAVTGSRATLP